MRARGSAALSCAAARRDLVAVLTPTEAAAAMAIVPFNMSRRLSSVDVMACPSLFGLMALTPAGPSTSLSPPLVAGRIALLEEQSQDGDRPSRPPLAARCPFRMSCASALPLGAPGFSPAS